MGVAWRNSGEIRGISGNVREIRGISGKLRETWGNSGKLGFFSRGSGFPGDPWGCSGMLGDLRVSPGHQKFRGCEGGGYSMTRIVEWLMVSTCYALFSFFSFFFLESHPLFS